MSSNRSEFLIPKSRSQYQEIVKRSRFIAQAFHIDSKTDFLDLLAGIRRSYSNANHNCWAYNLEAPGSSKIACSDDGEPQGTAGKPILNRLQHSDIGQVGVVVSRFFGGTKLGTGGLVRAYSAAAKGALESLETETAREMVASHLSIDFKRETALRDLASKNAWKITGLTYQSKIDVTLELPVSDMDLLKNFK